MELRQLRSLVILTEVQFNVSRTAERLHLVQSAVTQHLKQLETEVGASLFVRHGKRLIGLTAVGERVLCHASEVLRQAANITAVGLELRQQGCGILRLGATHMQARYILPPVIQAFVRAYPDVELHLQQGTPSQLVDLALRDQIDIAICTEALGEEISLETVPCYCWNRALIAPLSHPLLQVRPLDLASLCTYPIITYLLGTTGRNAFANTIIRAGLEAKIVLSAADSDVIKTYVRAGLGVGIIAAPAFQPAEDTDLGMRDLRTLFPTEVTKIAYCRDKYLRKFHQHFIEICQGITHDMVSNEGQGPQPGRNLKTDRNVEINARVPRVSEHMAP